MFVVFFCSRHACYALHSISLCYIYMCLYIYVFILTDDSVVISPALAEDLLEDIKKYKKR